MRIRKLLFSFIIILTFAVYAISQRKELARQDVPITPPSSGGILESPSKSAGIADVPAPIPSSPTPVPVIQKSPPQQQAPTPAPTPAPVPVPPPQPVLSRGMYRDGTYTGSVADAYYGNVQVQATVSSGKITDVTFLQHPGDRSTSIYINSQAMPLLSQEALQVQNANVDIVSGATDTSQAFQQSLAYALSQAKN